MIDITLKRSSEDLIFNHINIHTKASNRRCTMEDKQVE